MTAYTFTIDLADGDSAPRFVITWLDSKGSANTLPANNTPHLEMSDSMLFKFTGVTLDTCSLYARPLTTLEPMSPFSPTPDGSPPEDGITPLSDGTIVYVVKKNGSWSFSIMGFYQATNLYGQKPFTAPFLIDPDADVGTGQPP